MLDKQLHKHIDAMDEIEMKAQEEIDALVASIDIDEVMADPEKAMEEATEEIRKIMVDKYIEEAGQKGIDLARLLNRYDEQGKEIIVDPSKDGQENKEIVQ